MMTATPGTGGHGRVTRVAAPAGLTFLSGVRPDLAEHERELPTGIGDQLQLTLDNLLRMLEARDLGWESVAKVLLYLTDAREVTAWEEAVSARFGDEWRPALTIVQVDNLVFRGERVQLDVVAGG